MDWTNLISAIANLGKTGTAIYSAFQPQEYPPGYAESLQAASDADTYLRASANPNSKYFRPLAEAEEGRLRRDLISTVHEIIRAQAAQRAHGMATINPERRDETVWGALMRGFQDAGYRAREMARQQLINMSTARSRAASSYGDAMRYGLATDVYNRTARNAGLAGSFDALGGIGDWLRRNQMSTGAKPGSVGFGVDSIPAEYRNWPGNVPL